ncbi:hypothetical protein [Thermoactinospora rubra]|uniref:hypothetical protein n=1 Tax=Thermoactinospora rubra TaxID=1088767 RepID=UPI000A0FEBD6|nr:hypothetical protein [Thermoactinospora rubra]
MTPLRTPRGGADLPNPWPPDRYEVRCDRGVYGVTEDRYHFPEIAREAAHNLRRAGLARQILVRRLSDAVILFDHPRGVELPATLW